MNPDLYNYTLVQCNTCSVRHLRVPSALTGQDHNPKSSQFCHSWNARECRWPFGRCQFRHDCEDCRGEHRRQVCPYQFTQGKRRSRSPTPTMKKHQQRWSPAPLSFGCVHSFSGFCSQAMVSCSSWLRSSSTSSCGHSTPSWACSCFFSFTHPCGSGPLCSQQFLLAQQFFLRP